MTRLTDYTPQQSRFDQAFSGGGTCCSVTCGNCGRTYFVTSPGHGDYEEGELDELRRLAESKPSEYIEVPDYSSVNIAYVFGKQVVVGCLCDPTKEITNWIEKNAHQLVTYLRLYWEEKKKEAERKTKDAEEQLKSLNERV